MERNRTIAATPVRSASDAWRTAVGLITDTLERSSDIPDGSVERELASLNGLGAALVAGGHLETDGLVLIDEDIHLTIRLMTGDSALNVDENLNPVPGGGTATDGWTLYLPTVEPLASAINEAAAKSKHVSVDSVPSASSTAKASESKTHAPATIDVDALRGMRKQI